MAKLTAKKRNAMPKSQFAIPEKREFPLDTAARARNALSRVSQFGSSSEKARVRKAVAARYPSIQVSGMKKKGKKKG